MYYQYTTTCSCVLLHLALCINRLSRSINKSSFRWWIGSFTVYLAKMPQAPKAGFAWVKSVTWVKALISTSHYNLSWQTYHENCSKSFILQHLWRYFFLYEAWSTIKLDQISSQQFFDLRILFFYAWTSMNLELKKRLRISNPTKSFCNGQYLYETWLL